MQKNRLSLEDFKLKNSKFESDDEISKLMGQALADCHDAPTGQTITLDPDSDTID